jgi:hypothetical protein
MYVMATATLRRGYCQDSLACMPGTLYGLSKKARYDSWDRADLVMPEKYCCKVKGVRPRKDFDPNVGMIVLEHSLSYRSGVLFARSGNNVDL